MEKNKKIVYNSNGVDFTIYRTTKHIPSGLTTYWVLEDYSTGKRRLLNNPTELAARQRADQIRAAMAKGQASRLALNNGQWQDVSLALEIVRSTDTGNSLATVAREWAECDGMLESRTTLFDAVKFFLSNHHHNDSPAPKSTNFAEAAKVYHSFKVKSGISESHCGNIHSRLTRLGNILPSDAKLDELTHDLGIRPRNLAGQAVPSAVTHPIHLTKSWRFHLWPANRSSEWQ